MKAKYTFQYCIRCLLLFYLQLSALLAWAQSDRLTDSYRSQLARHFTLPNELSQWLVTHRIVEGNRQYYYLRQLVEEIPIFNVTLTAVFQDQRLVYVAGEPLYIYPAVLNKQTSLSPQAAFERVLQYAEADMAGWQEQPASQDVNRLLPVRYKHTNGVTSSVQLYWWFEPEDNLRAVWVAAAPSADGQQWWEVVVDATSGQLIERFSWGAHDYWGNESCIEPAYTLDHVNHTLPVHVHTQGQHPARQDASYRVYALPVESPSHGERMLVSGVHDAVASPHGWHDIDGMPGAEFSITRGNNVYAYEDRNSNNQPGYSPDGGTSLSFDFPLDDLERPQYYLDAIITNLFYWNNIAHDIFYRYGFNEKSGNFQENNYGRGGHAGDPVLAEAQDGGGFNNANFTSPPDGMPGRMQMYLWTQAIHRYDVEVQSPSDLYGLLRTERAVFGRQLETLDQPISEELVLVDDGSTNPTLACNPIINNVNGKIALIDRGTCTFVEKVRHAQQAGAKAVIIINNVAGNPIPMGGSDPNINIPVVMVSLEDGSQLKQALQAGQHVVVKIFCDCDERYLDSSLDNGVIIHEYGHGVSIRLTGGASNSSCLNNEEQMGEGWSDWFAILLTMKASDTAEQPRGVATFMIGEPTDGRGIRPAPYTTNMQLNPYTYADISNPQLSVPHGVGFVWGTMLWDLTWKFIEQYGFDDNWLEGNGGNNIILRLVIEALKLQRCSPGFVDGRDALLAADQLLYNGIHHHLIWEAFARRGLGWGAQQGSSFSRSDGVASFALPPCQPTPGYLIAPNSTPWLLKGSTLPAFGADGGQTNNPYYERVFLLSQAEPPYNVLAYSPDGHFAWEQLDPGGYRVWLMLYARNNAQPLEAYLLSKPDIASIQSDIGQPGFCGSLSNRKSNNEEVLVYVHASNLLGYEVQLYPNPAREAYLHIELGSQWQMPVQMHIFDLQGKHIWTTQLPSYYHQLRLPTLLKSGMYVLQLTDQQDERAFMRLIIY